MSTPGDPAIQYQNELATNDISHMNADTDIFRSRIKYQLKMNNMVHSVNDVLILIYWTIFTLIHILLFHQYILGVQRSWIADSIWITVLFLYPYAIYSAEKWIYDAFQYLVSFAYGNPYAFNSTHTYIKHTDFADPMM